MESALDTASRCAIVHKLVPVFVLFTVRLLERSGRAANRGEVGRNIQLLFGDAAGLPGLSAKSDFVIPPSILYPAISELIEKGYLSFDESKGLKLTSDAESILERTFTDALAFCERIAAVTRQLNP